MNCSSCGADAGEVSKYCPSCGSALDRAHEGDPYLGRTFQQGKYRLEALVGEGGMGRVYRATQTTLGKPVVLKVLRASLTVDERTVARFQREARAASRLSHPNSISILDYGELEDGARFIAMEYVAGRDLHQILSSEWPLGERRVIHLVGQVLSALEDAHSAGVIHRDLKPENIMVESRRGEELVKVLDFGIAKIQDPAGDEGPSLTRAGFVCGTPEYISPEQARGGFVDARSDLYAVGVILYQLMTGKLPFEADSAVGFATKHLNAEPPLPSRRRPDVRISPGMERLILKALAKNPADRPQSADQFRQELLALDGDGRGDETTETHLEAASEEPLTTPAAVPASAPGVRVFRLLAVGLALGAAGLGVFVYRQLSMAQQEHLGHVAAAEIPPEPPTDNPPKKSRDPVQAEQLMAEGDRLHARGELEEAIALYQRAFRLDPRPDLSLRLGELNYRNSQMGAAKEWFSRYLQDKPQSKARRYIVKVFPELAEPTPAATTP